MRGFYKKAPPCQFYDEDNLNEPIMKLRKGLCRARLVAWAGGGGQGRIQDSSKGGGGYKKGGPPVSKLGGPHIEMWRRSVTTTPKLPKLPGFRPPYLSLIAKYGILDEMSLVRDRPDWWGFGRTGADLTRCRADFAWCGVGLVRVSPGAAQPRGFTLTGMIKPRIRHADTSRDIVFWIHHRPQPRLAEI